ncbi:MAG: gamma carbonic anhydrase family protein [Pseudomonadota bacterium]|uniref:gamma carbonic anhydrase family protein n=1 Tax=Methyloversatilis sp. TaxID=2569862 RepID=UPI0027371734|nr:gamma carbonic anhydrase family protein [Methyloversatilis sp.]MDP3874201.1 gamma carbonic anhydrase family protein [Methyloversatilis sp.]
MSIYSIDDQQPDIHPSAWIASNATVIGEVELKADSSVWFGAVIRADNDRIVVGERSNVQDGAVLHIDEGVPLTIGDDVTVGHHAMLHGCTIGDGSLIGIKAVVMNRAVVGRNCLIGANALIPEGRVIPDRSLVVGSPGRIVRELSDEEVAALMSGSAQYVDKARHYRTGLKEVPRD